MAVFSGLVWIYISSMLVSGSGSTLSAKGQSQFNIAPCKGCEPIQFNHPYIQTMFMFIGEFCCIFVFLVTEAIRKRKGKPAPTLIQGKVFYKFWPHVFLFLIPTCCDLISSTFFNIAIYYSIASVYQILRNVTVIFVAALSACIWKDFRTNFDLPQVIGLLILFLGATTIALASILFTNTEDSAVNPALGVLFTILGCFFGSLWYITEEISLRKIQTIGLVGVANEGGWGLILYAILLPIFNHFNDPFSKVPQKFEDVNAWAYQIRNSYEEILLHFAYPLFVLVFNFTGMEITNHVSSATRSTFDACRTILVWIVSFIVGWEKWHTGSTLTRFAGFILVTCGVLLYNNVFRFIPFLKHNNIAKYGRFMGKGGKAELQPEEKVDDIAIAQAAETVEAIEIPAADGSQHDAIAIMHEGRPSNSSDAIEVAKYM